MKNLKKNKIKKNPLNSNENIIIGSIPIKINNDVNGLQGSVFGSPINTNQKKPEEEKKNLIDVVPDAPLPFGLDEKPQGDAHQNQKTQGVKEETLVDKQIRLLMNKIRIALRELTTFKNIVEFASFFDIEKNGEEFFKELENKKILKFVQNSGVGSNKWLTGNLIITAKQIIENFILFCKNNDIKKIEDELRSQLGTFTRMKVQNKQISNNYKYISSVVATQLKKIDQTFGLELKKYVDATKSNKLQNLYNTYFDSIQTQSPTTTLYKEKELTEILFFFNSLTSFETFTTPLAKSGNLFGREIEDKNLLVTNNSLILTVLKNLAPTEIGLKSIQWSGRSFNRITSFYSFDEIVARNFKELQTLDSIKDVIELCGLKDTNLNDMLGSVILNNTKPNLFVKDEARDLHVKKAEQIINLLLKLADDKTKLEIIAKELIEKKIPLTEKQIKLNQPVVKMQFDNELVTNQKNKLKKVQGTDENKGKNNEPNKLFSFKLKPVNSNEKNPLKEGTNNNQTTTTPLNKKSDSIDTKEPKSEELESEDDFFVKKMIQFRKNCGYEYESDDSDDDDDF